MERVDEEGAELEIDYEVEEIIVQERPNDEEDGPEDALVEDPPFRPPS